MAPPLVLPIDAALAFDGNRVTDHNRTAIQISIERKENRKRMADGTLRTFVVAQKRQIKTSWTDLPAADIRAVEGFWAADSLKTFYDATLGSFTLRITYGDGEFEDLFVMFKDFSMALSKRSSYNRAMYDLDLTLEEV